MSTTLNLAHQFVTADCCHKGCGVTFAMTREFQRNCLEDHSRPFYCPNGHRMFYTGPTTEQKLRDAEARETAVRDQLAAAVRDAESTRVALVRDRHRFVNGVCPCCSRSFTNVRRHMATKHPDYDVTKVAQHAAPRIRCSCGRTFATPHGLAIHQGRNRREGWDKPDAWRWSAHLTEVGTR